MHSSEVADLKRYVTMYSLYSLEMASLHESATCTALKWQSPKSCQRVPIMIVNRFIVLCILSPGSRPTAQSSLHRSQVCHVGIVFSIVIV